MAEQVYQPRNPKASPLWRWVDAHFEEFLQVYSERYQPRYGVLRDVIPEVVGKFLECGDLEKGFARVRCPECRHEFLVAFSCKARWFCPPHQKKVLFFGEFLAGDVLARSPSPLDPGPAQDAPALLQVSPGTAQRPLPDRSPVPDRVFQERGRAPRSGPRRCHGDSHIR